jgi:hypothetical protein
LGIQARGAKRQKEQRKKDVLAHKVLILRNLMQKCGIAGGLSRQRFSAKKNRSWPMPNKGKTPRRAKVTGRPK